MHYSIPKGCESNSISAPTRSVQSLQNIWNFFPTIYTKRCNGGSFSRAPEFLNCCRHPPHLQSKRSKTPQGITHCIPKRLKIKFHSSWFTACLAQAAPVQHYDSMPPQIIMQPKVAVQRKNIIRGGTLGFQICFIHVLHVGNKNHELY